MMFGGGGSGNSQQAQAPAGAPAGSSGDPAGTYGQPAPQAQPCEGEMGQFVQCALNSSEMTDCMGYLDMLKKCRDSAMSQNYY